jgi:D-glycero-D-manno-heptose 1,7-bisphosphate phosphatase
LKPTAHKAVFLDRDGTLIEEKNYLHKVEDVFIFPGTVEGLKRLQEGGFKLILVTNQSGIGRGYFTMDDLEKVHAHLNAELAKGDVKLDKIYIAPEHPDHPSRGRKPSPQFLFDARDELGIDLSQSYMIGDKLIDLECGWNADVKHSILVRTGYGRKLEQTDPKCLRDALVVEDLGHAADWILKQP